MLPRIALFKINKTICIYFVIENVIQKTEQKFPNYSYTKPKTFN